MRITALERIRDRMQREITHAEDMITFIEEYRFLTTASDDPRSNEEAIEETRQYYLRLIVNYRRFIAKIKVDLNGPR